MIDAAGITARIHAVLEHDGIPAHHRAAHLRGRCGVSLSTARRYLTAFPINIRADYFYKLADGLAIDGGWLLHDKIIKWHPRTFRIAIEHVKGYSPEDAARMVRLLAGYRAGHTKACNLLKLVCAEQMELCSAARLL